MTTLAELAADPHGTLARLRVSEPVSLLSETGEWLVTRWHDALRVLSHPKRYANEKAGVREVFRRAYEPGLSPEVVDTITRPIARKAADDMFLNGGADLTAEYFAPVAAAAGATLLGLGMGCTETLLRWGNTLARDYNAGVETDAGDDAEEIVERLRRRPDDSIVARLVHADADPVPLLKHLAVSVLEPGWLAAWTWLALWENPPQFAAVRQRRQLLGPAVYEALRWGGPVTALSRRTTRAVVLGGKEIPADAALVVAVASTNRDETVFEHANRFDVHRKLRPHLGFGVGPHHCPAHPMVTSLARTALDVLFERMPPLCAVPGWQPAPQGWRLRLPGPLDALFLD